MRIQKSIVYCLAVLLLGNLSCNYLSFWGADSGHYIHISMLKRISKWHRILSLFQTRLWKARYKTYWATRRFVTGVVDQQTAQIILFVVL